MTKFEEMILTHILEKDLCPPEAIASIIEHGESGPTVIYEGGLTSPVELVKTAQRIAEFLLEVGRREAQVIPQYMIRTSWGCF